MSSKADRRLRAHRCIRPIKVKVRQKDGTYKTQIVDASMRVRTL